MIIFSREQIKKQFREQFRKQSGVALITVMLIVALCAVIASQMTARLQVQMQRSANVTFNQQAYWYAMGAESFTKRALISIFQADPNITNLSQPWAEGEKTYPIDFGEISGEITDLQSCLNLNALRAPFVDDPNKKTSNTSKKDKKTPVQLAFEALLIDLEIENVSQFEAESMAAALTDWLDQDSSISSSGGAEDNDYASREFPYLAANNYLASINELRVIEHFTPTIINAIQPYVCVIPANEEHKININTINSEHAVLLKALLDSTLAEAQDILGARGEKGFASIDDFYDLPAVVKLKNFNDKKDQFVTDSEYFNLKSSASFNNSFFAMNSIMKITDNKYIDVISRTVGHN